MLGLKFETETSWVEVASAGLEQVLTDHAFAEQKAASNAVSLIINYSEETELVQAMSDIAIEEMEHFKMVHEFMVKRGMTLGRDQSNDYARHLQGYFPKTGDRRLALIHRLLDRRPDRSPKLRTLQGVLREYRRPGAGHNSTGTL